MTSDQAINAIRAASFEHPKAGSYTEWAARIQLILDEWHASQLEMVRPILVSLSLADHVGDVNNDLPRLAKVLGFEEPEWSDERQRMIFPWEDDEDDDDGG